MPRLGRWAMLSESIEGHEWGTDVALARSSEAEHGIASRPRGPRWRNSRRTPRDCCHGMTQTDHKVGRWRAAPRPGEPGRGRAGAGEEGTRGAGAVRDARGGEPQQRCPSSELCSHVVTGERPTIERLMGSFGGGPLEKDPSRQLAGGLPYRMHGSKRGDGETANTAPCPYPTRVPAR
jgi:hypothetical protein